MRNPDNIGFAFNNAVKLFDFGLAKELDPYQKLDNGLYKMSGGTGSRRFSKLDAQCPHEAVASQFCS
jgi:serine/threonine protein kinase